jgi:hypothetical protein
MILTKIDVNQYRYQEPVLHQLDFNFTLGLEFDEEVNGKIFKVSFHYKKICTITNKNVVSFRYMITKIEKFQH